MQDTSKVVKTLLADAPGASGGPRRIAVIGRAGTGKTTVALALGGALGLPVVHLDQLAWRPGWRPVEPAVFDAGHAAAIAGEVWVLDGGYLSRPGWPERVRRAELVVLVEAPLHVCLWRIMRRGLGGRRGSRGARAAGRRPDPATGRADPAAGRRPDLPPGCIDGLSAGLMFWTITWRWRTRAALRALRRAEPGQPPLVRVHAGTLVG